VCHRTVSGAPSDSVRCTREERFWTCQLREFGRPLHYNSPDCPVCQRSNGYFAPTVVCKWTVKANSARLRALKSEQAPEGAPDSEQDMSGAPPDYPGPTCQSSNDRTLTVGWRGWRTGQCLVRPSTDSLSNGHFGGWCYKYLPTTTLQGIQAFTTSHSIQEQYTTLQDTNQSLRSNQSPQFNSSF
jgi:hypothetical protein